MIKINTVPIILISFFCNFLFAQNTFQPRLLIPVAGNGMVTLSFETDFTAQNLTFEVETLPTGVITIATRNPAYIWNLTNGNSYQFRVRSVLNGQYSPWSENSTFVTPTETIQTSMDALKQVALTVATERRDKALTEGRTADANQMTIEIEAMQTAVFPVPSVPYYGPGFFPQPIVTDTSNPFLNSINNLAISLISNASTASIRNDNRDGGNDEFWLINSPYSSYKFNPVLFKIILNYVYDCIENNTGNIFVLVNMEQSFGAFILPHYKSRIFNLINYRGYVEFNQIYENGFFANLEITRMYHSYLCSKFLKDQYMWDKTQLYLNNFIGNIAGDGAYLYIGNQNSHGTYHGGTNEMFLHMYSITGYPIILEKLKKSANYEIITAEGGYIKDFRYGDEYIGPGWKKGQVGFNKSGTWLTYVSESPYQRSINGGDVGSNYNNAIRYPFFKPNINGKPIPNNYLIYDRNILGPKRRKNNFSFAITGRTAGFPRDIALSSHVGALNLDGGPTSVYNVSARINNSQAMIGAVQSPKINMSKLVAGFSAKSKVYYYRGGPTGGVTDWAQFQQWVALPDRLVGYVELTAPIPLTATQNEIWIWLTRSGSPIQSILANKEFNYNSIKVIVHETNFENVEIVSDGISIRNNNQYGVSTTYPAGYKKYAIIEIREANNPINVVVSKYFNNDVYGLNITQDTFNYSVWRNYNTTNATINLSSYINPTMSITKHLTRTENSIPNALEFTGNSLTLAPDEQVLLVNSSRPLENSKSWDNFDVLLEQLPKINISRTVSTSTFGQAQTFESYVDNANTNSMYQWKISGNPVPGANSPSFTTNSLVNGQYVTCELSSPLEDGTFYTVESNKVTVSLSLAPDNCAQGAPQAFLVSAANKICAGLNTTMSVRIINGIGPFTVVYNNGTANITVPNYSSGDLISLNPIVTTTYSLVSVTSSTGCVGTVDTTTYTLTIDTGTSDTATYMGTNQTVNHSSFTTSQKFSDNATCASQFVKVIPASACPAQVIHQGITYTTLYTTGQCWIKENIKAVPTQLPVAGTWQNNIDAMWHGEQVGTTNAYYYQWSAAMNGSTQERAQGVCPTGFHIPSDCEWMFFEHNLGMSIQAQQEWDIRGGCNLHGFVAKKLLTPSLNGTTSLNMVAGYTGFRALSGNYNNTNNSFYVWTSSQQNGHAISRFIQNNANGIGRQPTAKGNAMQVRCIKD